MTRIGKVIVRLSPGQPKLIKQYVLEDNKWRMAYFERGRSIFSAPHPGWKHRDGYVEYRRAA